MVFRLRQAYRIEYILIRKSCALLDGCPRKTISFYLRFSTAQSWVVCYLDVDYDIKVFLFCIILIVCVETFLHNSQLHQRVCLWIR